MIPQASSSDVSAGRKSTCSSAGCNRSGVAGCRIAPDSRYSCMKFIICDFVLVIVHKHLPLYSLRGTDNHTLKLLLEEALVLTFVLTFSVRMSPLTDHCCSLYYQYNIYQYNHCCIIIFVCFRDKISSITLL